MPASSTAPSNLASPRSAAELAAFARALLEAAAMPADKADAVADILVEGDLLGHHTHGLQLLPTYLDEIAHGRMTLDGGPEVLSDQPAALAWDGRRLPGPWLTLQAIAVAGERAARLGTGTVSIRRCHHIAALATYARRVAERGQVLLLLSSAPASASVAPFGGARGVFSPSPIGFGFPTGGEPVMVDVSTSITTNGLTSQLAREGRRLPHAWLLDEEGRASDDPAVLQPPRQGSIQPLGGMDHGHKGFGLALMVEALTAGLAGQGRSDPGPRWGATVFVQVLDPAAFNGREAFAAQMDWVAAACENTPPARPEAPVRLPGRAGLKRRRQGLGDGVVLQPAVVQGLRQWGERLGVATPWGG
ncbi:Ldh family oxidoreductase [Pseudorhodoferax sp.]|uniref:Ldh family oxidoreductase n=1 Tax=Pseudorhodoferax sp. TaxID=1993553 RepID=UPI002DD66786|nr:Ldh family oxidoreductase [Pseudorhodoferax sp.]